MEPAAVSPAAPCDDVTAFVLAGGRSIRMGADKAFLSFRGRPLLEIALQKARSLARQVRIVGPREKFAGYGEVVEDLFRDRGPLAGIHAALTATATELNLILAVDTPSVPERFLWFLVEQAQASAALVTVPYAGGGYQPLCAVYRREFGRLAKAALQAGRNKIDALFAQCEIRRLDEAELSRFEFPATIFDNLNTPEELERAGRRQD